MLSLAQRHLNQRSVSLGSRSTQLCDLRTGISLLLIAALAAGCSISANTDPANESLGPQNVHPETGAENTDAQAGLCGGLGEPCCPSSQCNSPLVCDTDSTCGGKTLVLACGVPLDPSTYDLQTWEFDGKEWTQRNATGPVFPGPMVSYQDSVLFYSAPIDTAGSMWRWDGKNWTPVGGDPKAGGLNTPVFSRFRDDVLLCLWSGGAEVSTWTWNGSKWTNLGVASHCGHQGLANAEVDEGVLVTGGRDLVSTIPFLNETYLWDGTSWNRIEGGPSSPSTQLVSSLGNGRAGHAMASLDGRAYLFGGLGQSTNDARFQSSTFSDTLEWSDRQWKDLKIKGPSPRSGAAMAGVAGRIYLYGGRNGEEAFGDTWAFDGTQWSKLHVDGPPPGAECSMAIR